MRTYRTNNQIKHSHVRVILEDNSSLILPIKEAILLAKDKGLDLIEINSGSNPVITKIADYGKLMYSEKKKATQAKKHQKIQELKEITFRPNTEEHDLNHKLNQVKSFLSDGNKVKFTVKFRGREITHPDLAKSKFNYILNNLTDIVASPIMMEGKIMSLTIAPK